MNAPRLCWYGDDFTGATDTLAVLTQAGYRAMLFMDVPEAAQQATAVAALGGALDAVGIAGATRAMSPPSMRQTLTPAGQFFKRLGSPVIHYKVCSTFDSSPDIGNIGEAVRTLKHFVDNAFVPIVGGQPNLGRFCVFSNLFAAAGTGGTVFRIDRHPTMRQHPVTPMQEADLREHLAAQGLNPVAAMHYPVYAQSGEAQEALLRSLLTSAPDAVLMDVADATHLASIGRLIWQQAQHSRLLAVGPSGVAQALIAHWQATNAGQGTVHVDGQLGAAIGPVFAFAGSLSPVTARQINAATSYKKLALNAGELLADSSYAKTAQAEINYALKSGHHLLAYTAADGADARQSSELALATARFVSDVVNEQARHGAPLTRVGIAGGDTSSQAVKALGFWGLSYRGVLGPGVTVSCAHSDDASLDGMELMLKGGQMGAEDVFEHLIAG